MSNPRGGMWCGRIIPNEKTSRHRNAEVEKTETANKTIRHTTMKIITTIQSSFKAIAAAAFAVGLATSASAQRANANMATDVPMTTASSQERIMEMKKGDHYAQVCMECKSITMKEVSDEKEVAALCHDGGSVHCPSCKKKFTVKSVGPRPGGPTTTDVTIVNADGKECMFIVPVKQG